VESEEKLPDLLKIIGLVRFRKTNSILFYALIHILYIGPGGDPRGAGINTPESIQVVWSYHREVIQDDAPIQEGVLIKQN
jgi:hypothetical protein